MEMIAHDPKKAKQLGVSQDVGKEFVAADKGKKFGVVTRTDLQKANEKKTDHGKSTLFKKGGVMKEDTKMDKTQDKAMIKKAFKQHDAQEHKGGKGTKLALKAGGMCGGGKAMKKMAKGGGIEVKGKTKGRMV
jgi:hypothetical protein